MAARARPAVGTRSHTGAVWVTRLAVRSIDAKRRAPIPARSPSASAAARSLNEMGGLPVTARSGAVPWMETKTR